MDFKWVFEVIIHMLLCVRR